MRVVVNKELLQFGQAVSNGSHSLPTQLVLVIPQSLKAGEMSRHYKCSLVSVAVAAYVTDNFTDVQRSELELTECQQPSSGDLGVA